MLSKYSDISILYVAQIGNTAFADYVDEKFKVIRINNK